MGNIIGVDHKRTLDSFKSAHAQNGGHDNVEMNIGTLIKKANF
jgi:hypothetical protein